MNGEAAGLDAEGRVGRHADTLHEGGCRLRGRRQRRVIGDNAEAVLVVAVVDRQRIRRRVDPAPVVIAGVHGGGVGVAQTEAVVVGGDDQVIVADHHWPRLDTTTIHSEHRQLKRCRACGGAATNNGVRADGHRWGDAQGLGDGAGHPELGRLDRQAITLRANHQVAANRHRAYLRHAHVGALSHTQPAAADHEVVRHRHRAADADRRVGSHHPAVGDLNPVAANLQCRAGTTRNKVGVFQPVVGDA